jgi:Macrocin-O-methyltransferase (TylF)
MNIDLFLDLEALKWFLRGLPKVSRARALYNICRHTMTGPVRSRVLWDLCKRILKNTIPGDFVECGVWKGGSAGLMS